MTARLNQIIAIEKGIKTQAYALVSELNKLIQKPGLFSGFTKTYQPKDDAGETLPPERQRVQHGVHNILRDIQREIGEWMDIAARKDWSNCSATADIVPDERVLIPNVPVSHLLFLEKQLTDLHTFLGNLPVLDEAENWKMDENAGLYRSEQTQTHRSLTVAEPIVLYPATDKHPAQTQIIQRAVIAGYWTQEKLSGAMPKPDRQVLVDRAEKLLRSVKQAREAANMREEVPPTAVGSAIFGYVLKGEH